MNTCRSLVRLAKPLQTLPLRQIHCTRATLDRQSRGTITDTKASQVSYNYDRSVIDDSGEVLGKVSKVLEKPEALNFAVIMVKGKQFKVTVNDVIQVDTLGAPAGALITLDKVVLCGSLSFTLIGRPLLPAGTVTIDATVIEEGRSPFLRVLNSGKARVRSEFWSKKWRNMQFVQQDTTILRINKITVNKEMIGKVEEREQGEEEILRPLH